MGEPVRNKLQKHFQSDHESEDRSKSTYACFLCDFKTNIKLEMEHHFVKNHENLDENIAIDLKTQKRSVQTVYKCTTCLFKTPCKKKAHQHGFRHALKKKLNKAEFHKFINNHKRGVLRFKYPAKRLSHGQNGALSKGSISKSEDISKTKKDICELIREVDKSNSVKGVADESQETETCSSKDFEHIIGILPEMKSKNQNTDTSQTVKRFKNNSLSDQEIFLGDISSDEENVPAEETNEIIRIEVTAEDFEAVNPNMDESLPNKNKTKQVLPSKCPNSGCLFTSNDLSELEFHMDQCEHIKLKKSYYCNICRSEVICKMSLRQHILKNHYGLDENTTKGSKDVQAEPDISGRVNYKCWMCGDTLLNTKSLDSHTYIHAREDENFNLKVTYSHYIGEAKTGTVTITADPKYVPPMEVKKKKKKKKLPDPTILLEYDPGLPVYACDECNFKSNSAETLSKHKKLHWNAEKEKAYKSNMWFTCGICYFHCFDPLKFQEHGKTHRDVRPNIDVSKFTKNSWYF